MNTPNIKIFVSQRIDQDTKMIMDNPLFINIRCGAVFDKRPPEEYHHILGDDSGDNISSKRKILNEYTVMYWAWKNCDADYIGLCHYRRFLNFSSTYYDEDYQNTLGQVVIDSMADINLKGCGLLNEKNMRDTIQKYDVIVNQSYNGIKTVRDECRNIRETWEKRVPQYLRKEEFDILLETIKEHSPEYYNDAKEYMHGKNFRGFNCFVMKKEFFADLCDFLFPILFSLQEKFDSVNKSYTQNRAPAYAGEWLYSIWVYHLAKKHSVKIKECQLFAFQNTDPINVLHPFAPKSIPIVLAGRGTGRTDISLVIQSILIKRTNESIPIDIIILQQSDSSDKWQKHVREVENIKIQKQVSVFKNSSVRFFDPKDYIDKFECHRYNEICDEEASYKLMLPWILEKYSKVIYLENNIFINSDISNYWGIDLENNFLAATKDFFAIGNFNGYESLRTHKYYSYIDNKDILMNYFSTDILIMDLQKIRQKYSCADMYNEYFKISERKAPSKKMSNGIIERIISDTFNVLFYNDVKLLPQNYNKTIVTSPEYNCFLDFIPDDLLEQETAQIYAYSLRGINVPICYSNLSISNEIADTMKGTPFYEQFIQVSTLSMPLIELVVLKDKFMHYFLKLIPYNSRRWRILKKLLK